MKMPFFPLVRATVRQTRAVFYRVVMYWILRNNNTTPPNDATTPRYVALRFLLTFLLGLSSLTLSITSAVGVGHMASR
jgi:hypothetical protein